MLTVRTIMRATNGETDYAGDIAADTIVQDVLPLVVTSDRPYRVVEGAETGGHPGPRGGPDGDDGGAG